MGSNELNKVMKTRFFCNGKNGVFAKGTEMANLVFRGQTYYFYKKSITDMHDLPEYLYKRWHDLNSAEEVEITQETFVYLNWKFRGNMFKEVKSVDEIMAQVN